MIATTGKRRRRKGRKGRKNERKKKEKKKEEKGKDGCLLTVDTLFATQVDAHDEECFQEHVETGTRMNLNFQVPQSAPQMPLMEGRNLISFVFSPFLPSFQVAEGGFLDIDVKVCNSTINSQ